MRRPFGLAAGLLGLVGSTILSMMPATASAAQNLPELDRFYLRLAAGPRDLGRMMQCLTNRHPAEARHLLDFEPGTPEFAQASERFYSDGGACLFGTWNLRTSGIMALGSLAEILIRADKPSGPVRSLVAPQVQGGGGYAWTWQNLTETAAQRSLPLAYCLVDRHGSSVEALLRTRHTSEAERKHYNTMRAQIADCIPVEQGWTLQPQILRAALAVAYYKSARAAANPSSGAAQ